jgi:hypothetical protein
MVMETKKTIILFIICIIYFGTLNCKNALGQNDYSEVQIKEMLKSFYKSYLTVCSKELLPIIENEKLDSIKGKYCTTKLLIYIHKLYLNHEIDYNPFFNSQMIDIKIFESLIVRKDSIRNDIYYVSYTYDTITKKPTNIKLAIIKQKGSYKIDHIFLDNK